MGVDSCPAIEISGVSKSYPKKAAYDFFSSGKKDRVQILQDINLTVRQGDALVLMGPNGSGKTTLLKLISSLVLPDQGTVRLFGKDHQNLMAGKNRLPLSIVLGDERSFYWRLTGRQNLEFFGALYEIPSRELNRKIQEAEKIFEMDDLDKRYEIYSTGQKCRLALARSYMAHTQLILMDEPTKSLDHHAKNQLMDLIHRLNTKEGCTFLIVTHNLHVAQVLGTKFAFLNSGKLILKDSFYEFRNFLMTQEPPRDVF